MKSVQWFLLFLFICILFIIAVYVFIKRDWTPMLFEDSEYKKMLRNWEQQVEHFAKFCGEDNHVSLLYEQALDVRDVSETKVNGRKAEHRVFLIHWSQLSNRFDGWPPLYGSKELDFYLTCSTIRSTQTHKREIVYYSVHVNAGYPSNPLSKPPYDLYVNDDGCFQGRGYENRLYHPSNGLRSEGILYYDSYQTGWRISTHAPPGRMSK